MDALSVSSPSSDRNQLLGESFRQARKEMFVIIGAWAFFLLWTAGVCAWSSGLEPGKPVPTLFGMPRWAVLGVILPWLAACVFTAWFSMVFMQDTDLNPDGEDGGPEDSNKGAE